MLGQIAKGDAKSRANQAKELADKFADHGVEGVIFQPVGFLPDADAVSANIVETFTRKGIPVVLVDGDIVPVPERSVCDTVEIDNFEAGYRLARHVLELCPKGRIVCAYSRGSEHTIEEGRRGVYAKAFIDGGKTWGEEVCIANDPSFGEVTIGKGLDDGGAMLLWVRRWGKTKGHDLYRTTDGKTFEKIASPEFAPMPMQVTDVFSVPDVGLMSLWFAGAYNNEKDGHSWGVLTSADNGRTWTQHTIEGNLAKADWPTEQSAVYLGGGRILAIARTEVRNAQFQLTSEDNGRTWRRKRTNIKDVLISTPSLVYDAKNGFVHNYYYQRGAKKLKRRTAKADYIFVHPTEWPEPETLAEGNEVRPHDAGNVNAAVYGDRHVLAIYSGSPTNATVFVFSACVKSP